MNSNIYFIIIFLCIYRNTLVYKIYINIFTILITIFTEKYYLPNLYIYIQKHIQIYSLFMNIFDLRLIN